jgi:lipopolysaccharide transport system ATP-binding protein
MKAIVKVIDLGKCYRLGGLNAGYLTFREMFAGVLAAPINRIRGRRRAPSETLWALKHVEFDVLPGEVLGLIGHNGAGKSTLLKILSRVTVPTTGRTEIYGRLGSLLEVGTGFHPDLTGRENIFLNGAFLNIKRAEIIRRFDEIVGFSGIEKFIDTPVKWYSSGMYLRLAFSVAAHLDTEVLIMDEVLAVGDVGFQQKCLDKVHEIRNQGRTILFVSHNMAAVTRLCQRVILLDQGRIIKAGPAHQVVNYYLGSSLQVESVCEWPDPSTAPGSAAARLRRVRVINTEKETTSSVDIRHRVGIELTYEVLQPGLVLTPKIDLLNEEGTHLFATYDLAADWRYNARVMGWYESTVWLPGDFLSEGNLMVHASIMSHTPATVTLAHAPNAVTFQVVDYQHKDSARGDALGPLPGLIRPLLSWTTNLCREHLSETEPWNN